MADRRVSWLVWGILFLMTVNTLYGEIHRAKPNRFKQKVTYRVFPPGPAPPEFGTVTGPPVPQEPTKTTPEPIESGHSRETWIYSIISAILVGLSGIFPLVVIPLEAGKALRKGAPAAHLKLLLSFAVGGLLGDVFLHLLPEAWAHIPPERIHDGHMEIGLWVLAGMLSFLIIEKCFPDHSDDNDNSETQSEDKDAERDQLVDPTTSTTLPSISNGTSVANGVRHRSTVDTTKHRHENGHTNSHANGHCNGVSNGNANGHVDLEQKHQSKEDEDESSEHIKVSGWLNLMANVIDNFTHGLALAGSYCISTKTGIITTIAILLHEIPHEIGDFAILLRSGFDRWKAAKAQLLTASGGMLGAVAALASESAEAAGDRTAWILPFTSGGFIYIALVTVVPDLLKEKHPWESLKQLVCLLSGIGVMMVVTLFFD